MSVVVFVLVSCINFLVQAVTLAMSVELSTSVREHLISEKNSHIGIRLVIDSSWYIKIQFGSEV